jgi:hypothetical protein
MLLTTDVSHKLAPCNNQQVVTVSEAEAADDAMALQHQECRYQQLLYVTSMVMSEAILILNESHSEMAAGAAGAAAAAAAAVAVRVP